MKKHREGHFLHRVGWLRAAVLGANDGIVSTASLLMGVAAAQPHDVEGVMRLAPGEDEGRALGGVRQEETVDAGHARMMPHGAG